MKNLFGTMALLALLGVSAAGAAEKKTDKTAKPQTAMAAQDPKMAEMMKMGAPGENHKILSSFVGRWQHTGKFSMSADEKPQVSNGTSVNQWILGGRFLQQEAKGDMMGQPFDGLGYNGYDNMKGEYTSVWLDNMSTSIMTGSSQYDPATQTFTETGTFACPMTGEKNKPYRAILKILDKDHYSYEMFMKDKDGKEFKGMELQYTRMPASDNKGR